MANRRPGPAGQAAASANAGDMSAANRALSAMRRGAEILSAMVSSVTSAVSSLINAFGGIAATIAKVISLLGGVHDALEMIGAILGKTVVGSFLALVSHLTRIEAWLSDIGPWFPTFTNNVRAWAGAIGYVVELVTSLPSKILAIGSSLASVATGGVRMLLTGMQSVAKAATSMAVGVAAATERAFASVASATASAARGAASLAKSTISGIGSAATGAAYGLVAMARAGQSVLDTIGALGVRITVVSAAVTGSLTYAGDQFGKYGQEIATLSEKYKLSIERTQEIAHAAKLAGVSFAEMRERVIDGGESIKTASTEARQLGLIFDASAIKAAQRLWQAIERLKQGLKGLWLTIGQAVTPAVTEATEDFIGLVKIGVQLARELQPAIGVAFRLATALGTIGAVMSTAGWIPAIAAAGAAIYGLARGWSTFGDQLNQATATLRQKLAELVDWAGKVSDGFWAAIRTGDLSTAIDIAWAAARVAWLRGIQSLASITGPALKAVLLPLAGGNFADAMQSAWLGIQIAFREGLQALAPLWNQLQDGFDAAATWMEQRWNEVVAAIKRGLLEVVSVTGRALGAAASYDPTGAAAAAGEALNRLSVQGLAGSTREGVARSNAGLSSDLIARSAARASAGSAGMIANDQQIGGLRAQRDAITAAATAATQAAQGAASTELQDALQKAMAARAAMDAERARQQAIDESTRGMLGEQATAAGKTERGTVAATFSSAALSYLGGSTQSEMLSVARQQLAEIKAQRKEAAEARRHAETGRMFDALWAE